MEYLILTSVEKPITIQISLDELTEKFGSQNRIGAKYLE